MGRRMWAIALVAACDSADEQGIIGPDCQAVLDACIPALEVEAPGAPYCVDLAERADEARCIEEREGCVRLCDEAVENAGSV